MIHYHGGPITPISAAYETWVDRHAMVSFAYPSQVPHAAEWSQSFVLDNGAFTVWKQGGQLDVKGYYSFVDEWRFHPAFDWAVIPDSIEGDEAENDSLLDEWPYSRFMGVPVWHLHESLDRLARLRDNWPRVALGSSGEFADPGSQKWWSRMSEAMPIVCDSLGRPVVKLHGLRMLDPTIKSHIPLASGDSCYVALNTGIDKKTMPFQGLPKDARAYTLARRTQNHASASAWSGSSGVQKNLWLNG